MSEHPKHAFPARLERVLGLFVVALVLTGLFGGRVLSALQVHGEGTTAAKEHDASEPLMLGNEGAAADQAHGEGQEGEHAAEAEHATEGEHGELKGAEVFLHLFHHVIPHEVGVPFLDEVGFRNINLFQVIALVLMLGIFLWVRNGLVASLEGKGALHGVQRIFAGFVLFIRDEMVRPIMGDEDARKFTPYFLFVFFFIAFQNLLGLIPGGSTATASIQVTLALALMTLAIMVVGGMVVQGPFRFWTSLVPHGLPAALWPLMFVVELIGVAAKPFALMIRLFANMTAGHLVVLSFIGLIFYFGGLLGGLGYAVAVPMVGMSVFIMIIEGFVALLQAYIFTYLSILFVRMYLHPEH
ncbi:MAG: F0F1 ATP synthase subunit A [Planctomycetota bacterium]